MKRYEPFLLDETEKPIPPKMEGDGIVCIATGISELEACENKNQNKLIVCLYLAICELFEIGDVELQTSNYSNSFFIITKHETNFNSQEGFVSPELSRKKLREAKEKDISGAIIDLIRNRKEWKEKRMYDTLYL